MLDVTSRNETTENQNNNESVNTEDIWYVSAAKKCKSSYDVQRLFKAIDSSCEEEVKYSYPGEELGIVKMSLIALVFIALGVFIIYMAVSEHISVMKYNEAMTEVAKTLSESDIEKLKVALEGIVIGGDGDTYMNGKFVIQNDWTDQDTGTNYKEVYVKDTGVKYMITTTKESCSIAPLYNEDGSLQKASK